MSGATAALELAPERFARPARDRRAPRRQDIRAVAPAIRSMARPRPLYAVIVVGTVVGIVAAQLLLSVGLSQGAYEIEHLEGVKKDLGRTTSTLTEDLDRLASPQYLAANAQALGMVGNTVPSYLRLSDGAVLGVPTAAKAATSPLFDASLVPNAQTTGLPLLPKPGTVTDPSGNSVPAADTAATPVPLQDGLPTPTTR